MDYELRLIDGLVTRVDQETGEVSPGTPEDVLATIQDLRRQEQTLYRQRKALEAFVPQFLPEGAKVGRVGAFAITRTDTPTYRYERDRGILRALWDCPDIPQDKKDAALCIDKRDMRQVRALANYSAAARDLVERALEVVETKSYTKIEG